MNIFWTEERIRNEIKQLDKKTGLCGEKIPIRFNHAKGMLGQFKVLDSGQFEFTFSTYWYHDPDWPIESAQDTIKHEYAHYMNYVIYGGYGHGPTWKTCCIKVGADPIRLYSEERSEYYRMKHIKNNQLSLKYDQYSEGCRILHPKYGYGRIIEVSGSGVQRVLTVEFNREIKTLEINWVEQNCKLIYPSVVWTKDG